MVHHVVSPGVVAVVVPESALKQRAGLNRYQSNNNKESQQLIPSPNTELTLSMRHSRFKELAVAALTIMASKPRARA